MAKQPRSTPARKTAARSDSLLLRSAESLGRMIGALQRQLDGATRERSHAAETPAVSARSRKTPATAGRKTAKATKTKRAKKG